MGKWGFDGSSGHGGYKQCFTDQLTHDSNLFVTSYVPIQINVDQEILWKNPSPASTRYCRPIRFQFIKESTEVIVQEEQYFKEKIKNLQPTTISLKDHTVLIHHRLQLTMIDGKCCSALSDTPSCRCYLCGAKPTEMNNIDMCLERPLQEKGFEYGLSPLHCWIRFFEYLIHVSYRLKIQKWQARTSEDKLSVAQTKQYIQDQFRMRMGLIIDKPRSSGSGTSNDGNTARKFFKNSAVAADITWLSKELIDRCRMILECLSSNHMIKKTNFKQFTLITTFLVEAYPWFYLPPSVHKLLLHMQ